MNVIPIEQNLSDMDIFSDEIPCDVEEKEPE